MVLYVPDSAQNSHSWLQNYTLSCFRSDKCPKKLRNYATNLLKGSEKISQENVLEKKICEMCFKDFFLITSDPYISNFRKIPPIQTKPLSPDAIELLSSPSVPGNNYESFVNDTTECSSDEDDESCSASD
jgi:hypothetical protein